jgi:UDP-glucose 6-dehydrogenase
LQERAKLRVYDPAGMGNARTVLGQGNIKYADSVEECLRDSELCILATPWNEFKSLKPEDFTRNMKRPTILDCWRILRRPEFSDKLDYFAVGLNLSE